MYIVLGGLITSFATSPFLIRGQSIALVLPLFGCIAGAVLYRYRARKWPVDPTVVRRQWTYAVLALVTPPAAILMFTGLRAQGAGMVIIGLIVGASVAFGILLSGHRRDGTYLQD